MSKIQTDYILNIEGFISPLQEVMKSQQAARDAAREYTQVSQQAFDKAAEGSKKQVEAIKGTIKAHQDQQKAIKATKEEIARMEKVLDTLYKDKGDLPASQEMGELQQKIEATKSKIAELKKGLEETPKTTVAGAAAAEVKQLDKSVADSQKTVKKYGQDMLVAADSTGTLGKAIAFTQGAQEALNASYVASKAAIGGKVTSLKALRLALIATGIGAFVVILGGLVAWLTRTQEGLDFVSRKFSGLGTVLGVITDKFSDLGEDIINFVSGIESFEDLIKKVGSAIETNLINRARSFAVIWEGITKGDFKQVTNGLLQMGTGVENVVDKTKEFTKELNTARLSAEAIEGEFHRIRDAERALNVERAKATAEINRLREVEADTSKSIKERQAAAKQAYALEKRIVDEQIRLQEAKIANIIKEDDLTKNLTADNDRTAAAQIELENIKAESASRSVRLQRTLSGLTKEQEANTKAAIAELQKELDTLNKAALAAQIAMQGDQRKYLEEVKKAALAEIDLLEKNLKEKQRLAGLGNQLNEEQARQLQILRENTEREYAKGLLDIARQESDKLFELKAASFEKEVEAVERKYEKEVEAAKGNTDIIKAIEEAKNRELMATRQKIARERIQLEEQIALDIAAAQQAPEGTRPGSFKEEVFEREKQAAILQIQIEANQKRLDLLKGAGGLEAEAMRANLERVLSDLSKAQGELESQAKGFSLSKLFGITDDEMESVLAGVNLIADAVKNALREEIAANEEKIQSYNRMISEKQKAVDQEIALNAAGMASNIEGARKEAEELQVLRKKAIEDQQRAQKRQSIIDSAQQLGAIATASANVLKEWSKVGPLGSAIGIANVAVMIGAFIASKAKAKSATAPTSGFYKGGYTGDGHAYNEAGVVHKKEFVSTAETTRLHRPLLEGLHSGKFKNRDEREFLDRMAIGNFKGLNLKNVMVQKVVREVGLDVELDPKLPERITRIQIERERIREVQGVGQLQRQLEKQQLELERIRKTNQEMADQPQITETSTHIITRIGNYTYKLKK
jgi:hypothetical protein